MLVHMARRERGGADRRETRVRVGQLQGPCSRHLPAASRRRGGEEVQIAATIEESFVQGGGWYEGTS